jgi:uncharacterized membrane protein
VPGSASLRWRGRLNALKRHRAPDNLAVAEVPKIVNHHAASFSGSLPHPALFTHYDQLQSGFAERIMRMTEKRLDHQIRIGQG